MMMMTLILSVLLTGCTISVVQAHTEGTTSDVVDTNQEASPTVSPDIKIPLIGWSVRDRPEISLL